MNVLHLFFMYTLFVALVLPTLAKSNIIEEENNSTDPNYDEALLEEFELGTKNDFLENPSTDSTDQYSKVGRFLLQKKRAHRLTCNKFPRVCHAKGSPGPHCCKKKCVNVLKDRINCGLCGKKCKYGEICCNGKCVNLFFSKKHCGSCNKKCSNGSLCVFGLCNYASP